MLLVKRLHPHATLPTVAHPGSDLAYDLYALADTLLLPNTVTKVPTGIAAHAEWRGEAQGLLLRDRSSMASKGIMVSAGVIDVGYTGEICVLLTFITNQTVQTVPYSPPSTPEWKYIAAPTPASPYVPSNTGTGRVGNALGMKDTNVVAPNYFYPFGYQVKEGDKIAQMIPIAVRTGGAIYEVDELAQSVRGEKGFGSTGR